MPPSSRPSRSEAVHGWRSAWPLVAPIAACAIAIGMRGYNGLLAVLYDDSYYYFVTAENFVRTGRSTFDGVTVTTGYHPLLFAIDVALIALTGVNRHLYLTIFVGVCAALAVAHAFLLRRLLSRFSPSAVIVDVVVLLVLLRSLELTFCGLESVVVMPCLALCALATLDRLGPEAPSNASMAKLGLIAALTALARLDAILFAFACAGAVLLFHGKRLADTIGRGLAFGAGFSPFALYLAWNRSISGSFLTTSATAKTLRSGIQWNPRAFEVLASPSKWVLFVFVPLVAAALLASPWRPWRSAPQRWLVAVIFGFPVVYYGMFALRSSWQVWPWYLYPMPLCLGIGAVAIAETARQRGVGSRAAPMARWAVPCVAVLSIPVGALFARHSSLGTMHAAEAIAAFSEAHAGRYAMGDRAGLTAFLTPRPIVQLEGLVADHRMLDEIKAERPLRDVLSEYEIDYLVEAVPTERLVPGTCQTFAEPKAHQAGEASPKMHGTFCDPMLRFDDPVDRFTTLVYAAR